MKKEPAKRRKTLAYSFQLPDELMERIDRYVAGEQKRFPYRNFTRSDAVRELLCERLDQIGQGTQTG